VIFKKAFFKLTLTHLNMYLVKKILDVLGVSIVTLRFSASDKYLENCISNNTKININNQTN
jgi:hypothetical protein